MPSLTERMFMIDWPALCLIIFNQSLKHLQTATAIKSHSIIDTEATSSRTQRAHGITCMHAQCILMFHQSGKFTTSALCVHIIACYAWLQPMSLGITPIWALWLVLVKFFCLLLFSCMATRLATAGKVTITCWWTVAVCIIDLQVYFLWLCIL